MSATTSTAATSTATLTALQQALTPKTGMQRIPLSLETWQNPNTTSSKKLLNMYAEKQPDDARVAAALLSTPGFTVFMNVGTGPIRAINDDDPGAIYVVSGTHFWLVNAGSGTATDLGDIGVAYSPFSDDYLFYTIAVGPTAAVVCSPPYAYVSVGGGPVAQITTTWPDYGASSVAFLDGYYVFTGQGAPQFFFITKLADPTAVDALDFAALDAFPNAMFKVERLGTDLWFAGASGWEIWYDAGNADFPFRRRPNGILMRSVSAPKAIAKGDESLFWFSADNRVYRTVGYQEQRISTHGIERALTAISSAYVYNLHGHISYVMNMTDQSLVYDTLTNVWHTASSSGAIDSPLPWRGTCCAANTGFPLVGDRTSGFLLQADSYLSTDLGVEPKRQVVLPPLWEGTRRAFCSRLEIEMEVGTVHTPPSIQLEWSDDGGITYTGSRAMTVTAGTGQYRKRVYTTRLGSFRQRVFRLTAYHAMNIYAIDCDIIVGAH
jgi:hypothetical protein